MKWLARQTEARVDGLPVVEYCNNPQNSDRRLLFEQQGWKVIDLKQRRYGIAGRMKEVKE